MRKSSKPHKRHSALWITLLAISCVAGAELTASYFFAPDLFAKVTASISRGTDAAVTFLEETCSELASDVEETVAAASAYLSSLSVSKDTAGQQDTQLAENPLYNSDQAFADPSVTELESAGGRDFLTGGSRIVEYFQQSSPTWAEEPYGTDNIGQYGCGPTAMAMVVSSMTDTRMTPAEMAQWAVKNGHWAKHGGSYLSIVEGAADAFGLSATPIEEKTLEGIQGFLLSGDLVVALMGPGHFTKGGHFILIRGVTLDGSFLVADPNSAERSLMEWDPQLIVDELSSSTQNGAPLWAIHLA